MEQFKLKLKEIKDLTSFTKHFVFERSDNKKLNFVAGQFISLLLEKDGKPTKRNYSLANAPDSNTLEFSCAYIKGGLASELLFNLKPGDEIPAAGPFGLLVLPKENPADNYFFFATGTGVTPFRSMLPLIKERIEKYNNKFHLVFGVRHKEELLYRDDFVKFAAENPNFKFYACYSRAESTDGFANYEFTGRVQERIKDLNLTTSDLSYLCGNPNMVDDVLAELTASGIDRRNIKREKYISAK